MRLCKHPFQSGGSAGRGYRLVGLVNTSSETDGGGAGLLAEPVSCHHVVFRMTVLTCPVPLLSAERRGCDRVTGKACENCQSKFCGTGRHVGFRVW